MSHITEINIHSPLVTHLLDMMEYIDYITHPSRAFLNFGGQIDAGHRKNLHRYHFTVKHLYFCCDGFPVCHCPECPDDFKTSTVLLHDTVGCKAVYLS